MRRNILIGVFALVLLLALTACDGTDQSVDNPSAPEPAHSQRPTSSPDPAVSPDLSDSQEPDTSSDLEPDLLALDEGDELIFYHPNESYVSGLSTPYLGSGWVKMTQEEEEEYFGISVDLTDAVPDLAIAGRRFERYVGEYGVKYDVTGARYQGDDRHRTLNFWVGRMWKTIEFSDYYEAAKIPSSRVNGVEIKILSYTVEYWEFETEEGWESYAEDEPDRPEEAVYYSGPYYQAEFDCYGNHFSLQASGLTQEEFGRLLKHFTSASGTGTEGPLYTAPDGVRQPAESTAMEPDLLAPDEEDKLIFYYPEEGYGFYYDGGQTLTKDHVSMTWTELEEYLGVSLDLTGAVSDLVPRAQTMLGLYEDEDGIYNDANQLCYQSQGTHRMLDVLVGQVLDRGRIDTSWPWRVGGSYPVSRVNGVEITILSSPVEYWGLQTQTGWDAYAVDDPDRPEECVLCTKSLYMADFEYNGNHFSLQAFDLTEEEFGRVLKQFTM